MAFTPKEAQEKKQFDPAKWDATKSLDTSAAIDEIPTKDTTFPGMDQGTTGLLAGTGGVGKSWLILQLMLYIATGYDSLGLSRHSDWAAIKRRKCI